MTQQQLPESALEPIMYDGAEDTYIPLRKCTHADRDESPFPIPGCFNQCRPASFRRRVLYFDGLGYFSHFKLDQGMRDISVCVKPSE